MDYDEAIMLLDDVANEVNGELRTDYSGRGMYGKTCVAITCNSAVDCIETAAARGIGGAKIDSMGRHDLVYWTHIHE